MGRRAAQRPKRGRPVGTGGLAADVRKNRVVAMLTDAELRELRDQADARELPLGTMLYELVKRALRRRRR